jgi:hypothetical protein
MSRIVPFALAAILAALPLAAQEEVLFDRLGVELVSQAPFLEDPKAPGRYGPRNLFDGKPESSWAIGNGGPGTVIFVGIPSGAKELRLVNGYAASKELFAKNNRVRRLKASLWLGYSFPGRVTELGRLFSLYGLGLDGSLALADTIEAQAIALGIDWDRADEAAGKAEKRFEADSLGLPAFEREAYAKGTIKEYILKLEIVEIFKGSKWNDTCLSELSFSPEPRSIPTASELVGFWTNLRGADFEELELQEDGSAYAYAGARPWASGTWRIEEGCLKVAWEGIPEDTIYGERFFDGWILTLVSTSGAVEVYEGEVSGAP